MSKDLAWYHTSRSQFVATLTNEIVGALSSRAASDGWHIEPDQHVEWQSSVGLLQQNLDGQTDRHVSILKDAMADPRLRDIAYVILEYNFKRRGLRIDAVLLAPGVIIVIEFKRSQLTPADRDQVINYAINLREFHELTRDLCEQSQAIVVPVLALTDNEPTPAVQTGTKWMLPPWGSIWGEPMVCGPKSLGSALAAALALAKGRRKIDGNAWLDAPFAPSSTIVDAAISLFGQHEVAAIQAHAAPKELIDKCVAAVSADIRRVKSQGRPHLILVSGAPGAGKTLVGLQLAFASEWAGEAVFVTGNAPLVDVLHTALHRSYRTQHARSALTLPSGYPKEHAQQLFANVEFKIVKAHRFLSEAGKPTQSRDGSIVIFDEAQRTYESGRRVAGHALPDHEADLIMTSLERSYPDAAPVLVALLGQNQAINRGERGAIAWFEAAERHGWGVSVSDETLAMPEVAALTRWRDHPLRRRLEPGHLSFSMRFYRNHSLEHWSHAFLEGDVTRARQIADELHAQDHTVWMTRSLSAARAWIHAQRVGEERAGIIASAQGRRLAAEGLFVEQKPPIGPWMLAPTGDIRSSNMLETVQNQYQIQGLELDWVLLAWDADLRWNGDGWSAYKVSGAGWQRDQALEVAKNGYRVLLTRARKGMVIFVPRGAVSIRDETRDPVWYDGIADMLAACGAQPLD